LSISLAMKASIALGQARRFLVGNPDIQWVEVLVGSTLARLAVGESLAGKGETILDGETAASLGDEIELIQLRVDPDSGRQYSVVGGLRSPVQPQPWPAIDSDDNKPGVLRPWLLPVEYERLVAGQGEFLAELRPAVSLFLKFSGLDYDHDGAVGEKLDRYIREVQGILERFGGSLIQVTFGDKGSYLQAAFGAPLAHEDDAVRAAAAALELRQIQCVPELAGRARIGISRGRMRTGAYGGSMRRTYGVLGDEVNVAARLMSAAREGQILVRDRVCEAAGQSFAWEELPDLSLKGKSGPVRAFSLLGRQERRAISLHEPQYTLPMVGRKDELNQVGATLEKAQHGKGQVVAIVAEAGMGKSRLVAEVIHMAAQSGLREYGGECMSFGTDTSYLVWRGVWTGLFELDPTWSAEEKLQALESRLRQVDPRLVTRMPLLGPVLNLPIPDNDLTRSLDAELKKVSLDSLLVDYLRAVAHQGPILIVLESCHWIDPLSEDLLEVLGRAISDLPVLLVITRRPSSGHIREGHRSLQELPYYSEIHLGEFNLSEAEELIRLKLASVYSNRKPPTTELVQKLTQRSQGNPFYIEELINYLSDRGIDPSSLDSPDQLDLPTSLHSLILTRIDQRTESQKITLKVASVIGRVFAAALIWGAFPDMGDWEQIKADLDVLASLDLTPLEAEEPELRYLFKHIITQEVAYESLPYATRAVLHEQIAAFIERSAPEAQEQNVDLLAFHYERGENLPKKREYLRKAGLAAQAKYANQAALSYFQRLLPLIETTDKVEALLNIGEVYKLVGDWEAAHQHYQEALEISQACSDPQALARSQAAEGELLHLQGEFEEGEVWMERARWGFTQIGDRAGLGRVLHSEGTLMAQQGKVESARALYQESLAIRRDLDDKKQIASLLNNLGILARIQEKHDLAQSLQQEALEIRREMGDRWGVAVSLNNLGNLALDQEAYQEAREYLEEAISLQRIVGSKYYIANALNNLGNVLRAQGDYPAARDLYRESLQINKELGTVWQIAYILEDMAGLYALTGEASQALTLAAAASVLRREHTIPLSSTEQERLEDFLSLSRKALEEGQQHAAWEKGLKLSMEEAMLLAVQE
jgi:adenylate cyclase